MPGSRTRFVLLEPFFLAVVVACAPTTVPRPTAPEREETPAPAEAKTDVGTRTVSTEPPAVAEPEIAAPIPWSSLLPIHHVETSDALVVKVPEPNPKVGRRYPEAYMSAVKFAVDDARVPEHVAAITDAVILLVDAEYPGTEPMRVYFTSSPFGHAWTMRFPWKGRATLGIALPRAPHLDSALRGPSEQTTATGELRELLASTAPKRFRPRTGDEVKMESAPARLPDGATKVLAGWWKSQTGPRASGVVISIDDANDRVHGISTHRDYLTWASVVWIADLDGDGFDEDGWGHGRIEDEAYFVTHFADGTQELLPLYAAGH